MIKRYRAYVFIAAVFTVSAIFAYVIPRGDFFQKLSTIPLVGSLMALLVKILLDEASYQRELSKLEISQQHELFKIGSQNNFALAVSSHMANVAFDKHAEFSEKYAKKTHEALLLLFMKGPTEQALDMAAQLYMIRREFTVWLTSDNDIKLGSFEKALREIGAGARLENAGVRSDAEGGSQYLYKKFAEVMGFGEWNNEDLAEDRALLKIIQHLRSVLGTEELAKLRLDLTGKAVTGLKGLAS
jgi:hypothetical protein